MDAAMANPSIPLPATTFPRQRSHFLVRPQLLTLA
jgi:hypothetical protein